MEYSYRFWQTNILGWGYANKKYKHKASFRKYVMKYFHETFSKEENAIALNSWLEFGKKDVFKFTCQGTIYELFRKKK